MMEISCGSIPYVTDSAEYHFAAISRRRRERKYWIGPGFFRGTDRAETLRRIRLAFTWLQGMGATRFIEVLEERQALHKVYFGNESVMRSIRPDGHFFAIQHKPNSWINSTDIDVTRWQPERYLVESVQMHEWGHAIGLDHTSGSKDLMHPSVLGWYPTPAEVLRFQRRLGDAAKFIPIPQQHAGATIRRLQLDLKHQIGMRKHYVAMRQSETDKGRRALITTKIRSQITPSIQRINQELITVSQQWLAIKQDYQNVPGAR